MLIWTALGIDVLKVLRLVVLQLAVMKNEDTDLAFEDLGDHKLHSREEISTPPTYVTAEETSRIPWQNRSLVYPYVKSDSVFFLF